MVDLVFFFDKWSELMSWAHSRHGVRGWVGGQRRRDSPEKEEKSRKELLLQVPTRANNTQTFQDTTCSMQNIRVSILEEI